MVSFGEAMIRFLPKETQLPTPLPPSAAQDFLRYSPPPPHPTDCPLLRAGSAPSAGLSAVSAVAPSAATRHWSRGALWRVRGLHSTWE
eukprot:COSAG04_NODE_852_length_9862_cov_6.945229_5_plen_88_part_00